MRTSLAAYYLPKDDEDYQFCYVDQNGDVRGVSIPFQFREDDEENEIVMVATVVCFQHLNLFIHVIHMKNNQSLGFRIQYAFRCFRVALICF